jgi:hypothetical protein
VQPVYLLSDRTGITIEGVADAVLSQFPGIHFVRRRYPFIDGPASLAGILDEIRASQSNGDNPLILSSLAEQELRQQLMDSGLAYIDLFQSYLQPLEQQLHCAHHQSKGLAHGIVDLQQYDEKIDAVNFTLNHDDGVRLSQLEQSDVILIGVSRSGKTPTCLYLALHYGMRAANYPLTEDDMDTDKLPDALLAYQQRLFGLTILPERLHQIRQARRPDSLYASLQQCRREVIWAEQLFEKYRIPTVTASNMSIEELAVAIRQHVQNQD